MKENTRKSPREVIESVEQPELEEAWYKLPGQEPIVCSTERAIHEVKRESPKGIGYKRYMSIHTHPWLRDVDKYPSPSDIRSFVPRKAEKSMVVAQIHPETRELQSYFILRKKKSAHNTQFLYYQYEKLMANYYDEEIDKYEFVRDLDHLFRIHGIQWRYVPTNRCNLPLINRVQDIKKGSELEIKTELKLAA